MRQFPHTKRNHRSGNWVYFRRIPQDISPVVGQKFFERSLRDGRQSNLAEAWSQADREFENLVRSARSRSQPKAAGMDNAATAIKTNETGLYADFQRWDGNVATTYAPLSIDFVRLRTAIGQWGDEQRFVRAERLINDPSYREDESFFKECCEIGACGQHRAGLFHSPKLYSLTKEFIDAYDLSIPPLHGTLYTIERMLANEYVAVLEAENRWRNFDFSDMPTQKTVPAELLQLAPNGLNYIRLSELVDVFVKTTRKPAKTASKLKLVSKYISDIAGCDPKIDAITKSMLLSLQTDALKIPARLTAREKSWSFIELVEASNENNYNNRPRLTSQAVRSWFNLLGGCFNWAVRADLMRTNITTGIKPVVRRSEEGIRKSFSQDDLRIIFSERTFCADKGSSKFWLPWLALYTGARLNEIGQLLKEDVLLEPIPALIISDLPNEYNIKKRLKNVSARRIIPLHRSILSKGFLDFADAAAGPHLFADLPHNNEYEPTKAFSQWFGRYLRSNGVNDKGKVFHSFRHTFKDACRLASIEEEVHDALTGHNNSRSIGRHYGSGVPIEILSSAISKIKFTIVE